MGFFFSIPNIYFHEAQISWNDIFSVIFAGNFIDYNKTLINMKKDVVFNFRIFQ